MKAKVKYLSLDFSDTRALLTTVFIFVSVSIYQLVNLSVCLEVCLSAGLSIGLCLSPSVRLYIAQRFVILQGYKCLNWIFILIGQSEARGGRQTQNCTLSFFTVICVFITVVVYLYIPRVCFLNSFDQTLHF